MFMVLSEDLLGSMVVAVTAFIKAGRPVPAVRDIGFFGAEETVGDFYRAVGWGDFEFDLWKSR